MRRFAEQRHRGRRMSILFLIDARSGSAAVDESFASWLRKRSSEA